MTDTWRQCYAGNWVRIASSDSMAHSAKFSRRLIERIYDHAFERRWIAKGGSVVDPFGGVALGACDALRLGLDWTGIELEDKFVKIGGMGWACPGNSELPEWHEKIQCKAAVWPICADCLKAWRIGLETDAHHAEGNIEMWQRKFGSLPGWGRAVLLCGDSRCLQKVIEESIEWCECGDK